MARLVFVLLRAVTSDGQDVYPPDMFGFDVVNPPQAPFDAGP